MRSKCIKKILDQQHGKKKVDWKYIVNRIIDQLLVCSRRLIVATQGEWKWYHEENPQKPPTILTIINQNSEAYREGLQYFLLSVDND